MSNQERFPGKPHFTTSAKVVSIAITAAFAALLVSRTPLHMTEESLLPTPAAVAQSDGQAVTPPFTLSAEQYESAAKAAKQDDPPIASF